MSWSRWIGVIVCAVVWMVAPSAMAQRYQDPMQPRMTSKDVDRAAAMLGLSDKQRDDCRTLFEAYLAEHQEACAKLQDYQRAYQEAVEGHNDEHLWDEWRDTWTRFTKHVEKLADQFVADLKLGLTPEQAERWPRYEMRVRRAAMVERGMLMGERVDLVSVLEDLDLPAQEMAKLDPILAQYEAEFDRAIAERQVFLDEKLEQAVEAFQGKDVERLRGMYKEGIALCLRVRDINLRYARQISGELPEASRDRFDDAFHETAFNEIFHKSQAEIIIPKAMGLEDLSPEQRDQMDQAKRVLDSGLSAIRERWLTARLKYETERTVEGLLAEEAADIDPHQQQRDAVQALSDRAVEKIKSILTPEQLAKLPGFGRPKNLPKVEF